MAVPLLKRRLRSVVGGHSVLVRHALVGQRHFGRSLALSSPFSFSFNRDAEGSAADRLAHRPTLPADPAAERFVRVESTRKSPLAAGVRWVDLIASTTSPSANSSGSRLDEPPHFRAADRGPVTVDVGQSEVAAGGRDHTFAARSCPGNRLCARTRPPRQ